LTLILIYIRISVVERRTRQRSALDEMLERTEDFRSAQRLHAMLRDHGESISLATVYRTLQSMARDGEVDVLRTPDKESRYRRCLRQEHHHHLVCRQCGHTVEVTETAVERWADRTAREHGFAAVSHSVELQGVCAKCRDTALP
jgi:Fur family ferric uptake transcriptional regulator